MPFRILFLLCFAVIVFGCSSPHHYSQDTMREYHDKDYALFCAADDPKCFGTTQASDKIQHPYEFLPGFPVFPGNKVYYQTFEAEGSAEIVRIDSLNSFWLRPYEGGNSRILRFTAHYQQPDSIGGKQFNASLLGTKPLGSDTPELYKKATVTLSRYLKNRRVRYRCFGITNVKQAECFILINEDLDVAEWMLKNGFLQTFGSTPERYTDAEQYAEQHFIGFRSALHLRTQTVFPEFRKDRYGVCHSTKSLPKNDINIFYARYSTLDLCIQSGGIWEHQTKQIK